MIELDSDHPPLAIWYILLMPGETDFMGCLQPHKQRPGVFVFDFRFRHYRDDQAFDSDDEKHWYHVETKGTMTPENAIHHIRGVVLHLAEMASHDGPNPPDVSEMLYSKYSDYDAFMEALSNQPWAWAKMRPKEEADKLREEASKT